jgi:hypothetical protein
MSRVPDVQVRPGPPILSEVSAMKNTASVLNERPVMGDAGLKQTRIVWPEGKQFAFTVFDDTGLATVARLRPVYEFLADQGLLVTKSVWPLRNGQGRDLASEGMDCEDPEYLQWVLDLQARGFEIGLHAVASGGCRRDRTIVGIERFRSLFGADPITYSAHFTSPEGLYFGPERLSGVRRVLYGLYARQHHELQFRGHIEGDEFFWGDICRSYVKYVRNFVFADVNTLKACPEMPYYDLAKPYVNYWFASSEGRDVESFVATISEANQDRLAAEGGACIMYTHFAYGFSREGCLDPRFERLIRRLSRMKGWFVPVRILLDFLLETKGPHQLSPAERRRLEWRWLWHKARVGRT